MFEKVKNTIKEYSLLSPGDSVLVALSGGPDSVALLYLLNRLKKKMSLSLSAVYINHQIRTRAAKKEEKFCQKLCDRLRVDLTISQEDIPSLAKAQGKSLEQAARDFRYEVFENLAIRHGHDKIALGHHRDDRVETILFRILRGTGRTGLQGIPIKRGRIIRPLYHITKQEIYTYLKKHRLHFCLDQSNSTCDFARNYIRNKLLVDIRKSLNPAVDMALLNLSETAAHEEDFLEQVVHKVQKKIVNTTVGGKIELDLELYMNYNVWLRRRLLRCCLVKGSRMAAAPDKAVIDRLDNLCIVGGKAVSLPDGVQAVKTDNKLFIFKKEHKAYSVNLKLGKACLLPTLQLKLNCKLMTDSEGSWSKNRYSQKVRLDWEKLTPPLVVRNIKPGDRFAPLGMKGTKKIGDYLTDRKVEKVLRDEIPVVCDQQGIIWLVGFEIGDRVKIDTSTKRVIEIDVHKRRKRAAQTV